MEWYILRVSLPLFWTGPSTEIFHKPLKSLNKYSQENHSGESSEKCDNEEGYNHLSAAKSGFFCKYKEVDSATYKELGIFRNCNRLEGDDIIPTKKEGGIDF